MFILFVLTYIAFCIYPCRLVFDLSFVSGFPWDLGSFFFFIFVYGGVIGRVIRIHFSFYFALMMKLECALEKKDYGLGV